MARPGVKIVVTSPGLRAMTQAVLGIFDDVDKAAKPEMIPLGQACAEAVCEAIQGGVNLDGESLRALSTGTINRRHRRHRMAKRRDGYIDPQTEEEKAIAHQKDRRPLIETGLLSDPSQWRIQLRRDSKGAYSVVAKPHKDRDKVFYYLAKKGFTRVYGVPSELMEYLQAVADRAMQKAMDDFGRKAEAAARGAR